MTATPASLPEWHIDVDGCVNFRDAGGWRTEDGGRMRTGRLYRSDDPIRITGAGRQAVAGLGLARVIDLRQHSQFVRAPGFIDAEHTDHIPLLDRIIDPDNPPSLTTPNDIADLYEMMLDRSKVPLGQALEAVARHIGEGPVLVHCAYGKDRAGLVTALVQSAIGVPAEWVIEDYARSHQPGRRRRAWTLAEPLPDDPDTSHVPDFLFGADAESMRILLDRVINRHGSLRTWAEHHAPDPDTIGRIRAALLDR